MVGLKKMMPALVVQATALSKVHINSVSSDALARSRLVQVAAVCTNQYIQEARQITRRLTIAITPTGGGQNIQLSELSACAQKIGRQGSLFQALGHGQQTRVIKPAS